MTEIKQWLNRARRLNEEIAALSEERQRLFSQATSCVCPAGNERVQTSKQNTTDAKFAAYAQYSETIDKRINELYSVKAEILAAIEKIDDPKFRTLLELRYLSCYTWENVAEKMGYSTRWILKRLHPLALKGIKKILTGETK